MTSVTDSRPIATPSVEQPLPNVVSPLDDVSGIRVDGSIVERRAHVPQHPQQEPGPYLTAALAADAAGLSVLPPREDGSKTPDAASWTCYSTPDPDTGKRARLTPKDLRHQYSNGRTGVGAVMGRASGNVELFEFDDLETYQQFLQAAAECGLGDLVARIRTGYEETTPGGGIHWLTRCDEVCGNTPLARRPEPTEVKPKGVKVLVETRGNGGYAVLAPSSGNVHPTGKPYRSLSGGFKTIATLTPEERRDLWGLARSFDQMPVKAPSQPKAPSTSTPGERPGDLFNQCATWAEVLEPHGWILVYERNDTGCWRRPGKDRGISATTNVKGTDTLIVFSTSTPFETAPSSYNKFGAFTVLSHGGDYGAAARDLAEQGYRAAGKKLSADYKIEVSAECFRTAGELSRETPAEVPWIAKPFVAQGSTTELTGKIKLSGKTTFSTHLAAKVITGEDFAGEPTTKTRVVYLTEQPDRSFRQALRRAGLDDCEDLTILSWHKVRGIPWPDVAQAAVEEALRRAAGLLIVDTLGQFAGLAGEGENQSGAAQAALEPLQAAAAEHNLGVIIVRHERKSGGEVGDAGRGSSAWGGGADIILSLRRPEGNHANNMRIIHGVGRFDGTPESLVIELTDSGYVARGSEDAIARQHAQNVLANLPTTEAEAKSMDEIVEQEHVARSTAQPVIEALVADGTILQTGRGVKGKPHKYWCPSKGETRVEIHSAETSTLRSAERIVVENDHDRPQERVPGVGSLPGLKRQIGNVLTAVA